MLIGGNGLSAAPLRDARALHEAHAFAQRWQASGFAVDLIEYMPMEREPGGYVLTVTDELQAVTLVCRKWRQRRLRGRRELWTATIRTRRMNAAAPPSGSGGTVAPAPPTREVGVVAACSHTELWRQLEAWIEGGPQPHPTLAEALRALR
jgi:hypothetical protein